MKIRMVHLFVSLLLIFTSDLSFGQDLVTPDLPGFKKEFNYPVYTPDNLWDYINGGAESYNALGFEDLTIVEYKKGKKTDVKLELYKHSDQNMTFGIYALERAPSYNFNDTGVQGYSGEGFYNFFKGVYYVKIYTHSKSKRALEAVNILAKQVESLLAGEEVFPDILDKFPSQGRKQNEEMYISENVIGHGFLSDAFRVGYDVNNKEFIIYLFSREEGYEIRSMVQKYLERQDLDTDNMTEGKTSFKDGYNGDIFLAWKENMMILITGLNSGDSSIADKYISEIIN